MYPGSGAGVFQSPCFTTWTRKLEFCPAFLISRSRPTGQRVRVRVFVRQCWCMDGAGLMMCHVGSTTRTVSCLQRGAGVTSLWLWLLMPLCCLLAA